MLRPRFWRSETEGGWIVQYRTLLTGALIQMLFRTVRWRNLKFGNKNGWSNQIHKRGGPGKPLANLRIRTIKNEFQTHSLLGTNLAVYTYFEPT